MQRGSSPAHLLGDAMKSQLVKRLNGISKDQGHIHVTNQRTESSVGEASEGIGGK
jgi:hypothetical protein